jgi:thioredoxin 1
MNWIGIVVVSVVLLMVVWMSIIMIRAQKLKGDQIPKTGTDIDDLVKNNPKVLVYCYSQNCAQCVSVTSIIDKMMAESLAVTKVDISQNIELAQLLNIRATPTILLIENRQIKSITLGVKSESFIYSLINES